MINPAYVQKMARYNQWQNSSLNEAADTLSEDARRADRGAFFKSIHATFNHILWAAAMWMSRLAREPAPPGKLPESTRYVDVWEGPPAWPMTPAIQRSEHSSAPRRRAGRASRPPGRPARPARRA